MLNQHALNGAPRYASASGEARCVSAAAKGSLKRYAFCKAESAGYAGVTGTAYNNTSAQGRATGKAIATATAWKVVRVSVEAARTESSGLCVAVVHRRPETPAAYSDATAQAHAIRVVFAEVLGERWPGPLNEYCLNGSIGGASPLAWADASGRLETIAAKITPQSGAAKANANVQPSEAWVARWYLKEHANAVAYGFSHESLIQTARIRQVEAKGSAVAKAHGRATPNTILGYGRAFGLSLGLGRTIVARAIEGREAKAEALAHASPTITYVTLGHGIATSAARCEMSLTHNGIKTVFPTGQALASANIELFGPVRWPAVEGSAVGLSRGNADTLISRASGRVNANALAIGSVKARINAWHFTESSCSGHAHARAAAVALRKTGGKANAEAIGIATPWHWIAQSAMGSALASADASALAHRTAWAYGSIHANALTHLNAVRYAYAKGSTLGMSNTIGTGVAGAAKRPLHNKADGLAAGLADAGKITKSRGVAVAFARGSARYENARVMGDSEPAFAFAFASCEARNAIRRATGRAVATVTYQIAARVLTPVYVKGEAHAAARCKRSSFKINAGLHAPDQRAIRLTPGNRTLFIAREPREYRIG